MTRKAIPGFPGYEIDTSGQVFSNKRDGSALPLSGYRDKKARFRTAGRRYYTLGSPSGPRRRPAAQLVLLAFVGGPPSPKHGALHRDDNVANDNLDNLYWGTGKDNGADRSRNRKGRFSLSDDQVGHIRNNAETIDSLARRYQVSRQVIWSARRGKTYRRLLPEPLIVKGGIACGA